MSDPRVAQLIVVTGVMAAGKSTVADALAHRCARSVHLRGDVFRRMIVAGRHDMTENGSEGAIAQLQLRYRAAAAAAREYLAAGFTVIHQDVVVGPALRDFLRCYRGLDVQLVVLCPRPEVVARREAGRAKQGYRGFTVEALDQVLRRETPRLGYWLDNSELSVDETVQEILLAVQRGETAVAGG